MCLAHGFYPVNPVSGKYIIGTPMLEERLFSCLMERLLPLRPHAKSNNEIYIRSMKLNGKKYTKGLYYSSGYYEWRNVGVCNDCLTGKMITNAEVLEFVPGKISKC